ncbi:MAG TPA: Ppx/GppA phosphatase family protein [Woeseiaceae bacterium]|nr:Ppx/GppA phosphatase family protein [Woeseiaceae bacterium]
MPTPPAAAAPPSASEPDAGVAGEVIAAVDLGSNSFHMVVGELRSGQLAIIDRLKETVRLSEGLKADGDLGLAAKKRALECLSRFGERLRDMRASSVRAAGTSTLRRARDSHHFIRQAERALGHPIEVISGIEEARLIFSGVTQSLPPWDGPRLVMDIGGGSTELIAGAGGAPKALESLHLGCVALTEACFPGGGISRPRFDRARLAARLEIAPVKAFFPAAPGTECIGTSGTILATEAVARELGFLNSGDLTRDAVERLIERVLEFDATASLTLPGLPDARAEVWPGGLAILAELLAVLGVERLRPSEGALREGLLYDQLGRLQHADARERSVEAMARRYSVDRAQARRVAETAHTLLRQCATRWKLGSPLAAQALEWAAALHEIGLDISHDGFQRHGAYIVENADLPGFPSAEQALLAFLIANQRRDLTLHNTRKLPSVWEERALRLALLLRLSVLLNRSRSTAPLPPVRLKTGKQYMRLIFPRGWLHENPLTATDLDRERHYLQKIGVDLRCD